MEIDLDDEDIVDSREDSESQLPRLKSSGRQYIRISVSGNEIDMVEWDRLWASGSKCEKRIMAYYDFYEDGKDRLRVE